MSQGVSKMTNSVIPFSFNSNEVRTIVKDDAVWFVASDIAKALDYAVAKDLVRMLDEDERGGHIVPTPSGDQEMTIINESGLYHALIKSRKPEAKPFRKWVTGEVLPTIRKTGSYTAPEKPTKQVLIGGQTEDQCDAIKALVKARAGALPQDKRAGAAIRMWSAVKSKFGMTYKAVPPEEFTNILSLIARVPLEGEFIAAIDAPKAIEAPTIPEGMVLVRKDLLEETNNMIKMIDERFTLVEQAEREIQHSFNVLSVITSGYMKQANDAIREARYRLIDPIKHAKSYTGLMLN
jgi:prophage antirepressor-like protein